MEFPLSCVLQHCGEGKCSELLAITTELLCNPRVNEDMTNEDEDML